MLKQNTSQAQEQKDPASKPRLLEQVCQVLDRPVLELAEYCLPRRNGREGAPKTGAAETVPGNQTEPQSQPTFAALVTEKTMKCAPAADPESDPVAALENKPSIAGCVGSSFEWAWRASKAYLSAKIATNMLSAVMPYALAYSGARVVDALVKISGAAAGAAQSAAVTSQAAEPAAHVLMQSAYTWFGVGAAAGLAMFALNAVNRYARSRHDLKTNQEVMSDMREALTGFDPDEHFLPETTQLVNRTLQSQWAIRSFGEKLFELVIPAVSAVGAVAIVAPYSPLGAALLGAFVVPYFYHSYKRGREEFSISEKLADVQSRYGAREWTLLTGPAHVEVKMYGKTEDLLTHLAEERSKIDAEELKPELAQQQRELWVQPLNTAAVTGVALVMLADVISKAAGISATGPTIGEYGLISGALYSLNGSIRALASSLGDMLKNLPQAQLAHAVMQKGLSRKVAVQESIYFDSAPSVQVEELYFSYPKTNGKEPCEALRGVSLDIRPGELIGIVGESGSGKSSLVNILCGIYRPSDGTVMINGTDIEQVSRRSLWACSGYLRQQSANFWSMTLRENIAVGARTPISDEQIMKWAEECGFAEVMTRNDLTLDSVLGQWFKGGKNLSGGEQALLGLTRQAASEAKFLVLDEPTAGLDQRRTDAVLERIRSLSDTTRIVISHDYGIAAQVDRIIVLDQGRVADIGTHAELLERCACYREPFERQFGRLSKGNHGSAATPAE